MTSQGRGHRERACVTCWAPPEADAEMGMNKQDVYLGLHLGSVPIEGRGRRQDGAERERLSCHAFPTWAQPTPHGNLELHWPHRVIPSGDKGDGPLSHYLGQGIRATSGSRGDPEPGSFLQVRRFPKGLTAGVILGRYSQQLRK